MFCNKLQNVHNLAVVKSGVKLAKVGILIYNAGILEKMFAWRCVYGL